MKNPEKPFLKRLIIPSLLIIFFGAGLACGWLLKDNKPEVTEHHEGQYEFINPLLECEGSKELISRELLSFKDKLEDLIHKEVEAKRINFASIYFRDLNNGPWIGINEKEQFLPGSLLKVPIMIAYLKKAETDPAILAKKIKYEGNAPPTGQFVQPAVKLEKGKAYTVEDLIYRMIVYSDNDATYILQLNLDTDIYIKTYMDLGLDVPDGLSEYRINVKKYASFFRILFNASYLNKEMSNGALKLLSYADFKEGLIAGVPPQVQTAQKFGESKSPDGQKQFHDCGIIYYPDHPYLLCVMTKGSDYKTLAPAIRAVSKLVFEEVDHQLGAAGK